MSTLDFIIDLFCRIDDAMPEAKKHSQGHNHLGLFVDWELATAKVYDGTAFQELVARNVDDMALFADEGFVRKAWHPANLKICTRGEWNSRMIQETVLSMLTLVCHFKKVMHRTWAYFESRLAYTLALLNLLVQWEGLQVDEDGCVHFSIAQFSL